MDKLPGETYYQYLTRIVSTIHDDSCWIWPGGHGYTNNCYAVLSIPQVGTGKAHRVAYELRYGPVPSGLEVEHTCENSRCWNPDHSKAVTHADNMARTTGRFKGGSRWNNICPKLHNITGYNEVWYQKKGRHYRECRTCKVERNKLSRRRK